MLCQYGDSAALCLCFSLLMLPNRLSTSFPLLHCSCLVMAPTTMCTGLSEGSQGVCPFLPYLFISSLSPTPNRSPTKLHERGFVGLASHRLGNWPPRVELLHKPISLATGHSLCGCLWVRHQFSVQSAVARKAGLRFTSCAESTVCGHFYHKRVVGEAGSLINGPFSSTVTQHSTVYCLLSGLMSTVPLCYK